MLGKSAALLIAMRASALIGSANRDGSVRKRARQRVIRLDGKKKPDNIAYAFRDDWRDFRGGWDLLS